ncbi:murein transglycosylase D [Jinshanibacter sp. LJY008]|uniref:peptidoglycan lytic exotransglycosylase n=1 Tax=Limnobaculum eriocheiris TaxID=2897391 RepID=A0A9X1SLJ0_9GAMM|nr:murein transglycosylase D [Limnobaculum eriocheiris]MCD1127668.1 murein transglycosylase D [Limnobaculum eriocheiris]
MKAKAILFVSVLLVGCQASNKDASQSASNQNPPSANSLAAAGDLDWLMGPDGQTERELWQVVSEGLEMDIPDNERIREQKEYYLNNKDYLQNVTLRAEPYMYWIISQIKDRHLPMELVLLPIVESAFNPHATSSASAAGIWQFIPTTGRYYGLKQDKWYDGRRDVAESTTAALDMLERLNIMFEGDWLQAIAAYNCGEGRVMRAIKENEAKGLPTDYWSLNLPRETQLYVPKLLALSDMVKHNERYALSLPSSNLDRALTRVEVGQQIELAQAAKMSGVPLTKLQTYNAGYKHNVTSPDGPHAIMLPASNAKQLEESLNNGDIDLVNWGEHKVVNGETIEILARRYGITVDSIRQANNLTAQVSAGQVITLPISGEYISQIATQQTQIANNNSRSVSTVRYTVRAGDTLASIAKRYNVKSSDIQSRNKLGKNSKLKAGLSLQLASNSAGNKSGNVKNTSIAKNNNHSITYRIRKGDSLASIAKRHNVNINDVLKWNSKVTANRLQPGNTLTLYKP